MDPDLNNNYVLLLYLLTTYHEGKKFSLVIDSDFALTNDLSKYVTNVGGDDVITLSITKRSSAMFNVFIDTALEVGAIDTMLTFAGLPKRLRIDMTQLKQVIVYGDNGDTLIYSIIQPNNDDKPKEDINKISNVKGNVITANFGKGK